MRPFKIFIGYDKRQPVAFHVAAQSILNRATKPITITPINIDTVPITRVGLTPFTYSRFLVPWLCGFEGRALFMDSDFLCRHDVSELFSMPTDADVWYVNHQGERRFERASLMLFDCAQFKYMTPQFVQSAKNLLTCDFAAIPGHLNKHWNHLVGYDAPDSMARMVHFTQGLPVYPQTWNDEFADEWRAVAKEVMSTSTWEELMGGSVHAPHVHKRAEGALHV